MGKGKRKIEMKKIENPEHRRVTFSKRRSGLFKKASELAIFCDVELAIIVQSPADKIYTFEHPSVEALINRVSPVPQMITRHSDEARFRRSKHEYEEAVRMLEAEERRLRMSGGRWWEDSVDGLGLQELQKYLAALDVLTDNVVKRVEKIPINSAAPLSIQDYGFFADSTSVYQDSGIGASTSVYQDSGTGDSTSVHQDSGIGASTSVYQDFGIGASTSVHQDYGFFGDSTSVDQDFGFGASTLSYVDQDLFSMLNFMK